MAEITAALIEERNKKYLADLQGNVGKYLSFLSTMARFHKYEVADLTSFAIEAPTMFTAVADKDLWAKHFHRKINSNAKGVTLIKDGKKTVFYDVSETESIEKNPMEVKLWQYDDSAHKKFIDAVVADENSTEKQIQIIAEELANRGNIDEKSKKLLALSVESVILERMGFSTENATRKLAIISFKEHDIPKVLEETQKTARIFLDAMQKSVNRKSTKNLDVPENNPLLEKIGVIKSASKIEQTPPEQELNLTDEPVQRGLFDTVTEKQVDNSVETDSATLEENMENIPSDEIPTIDDKNLIAGNEVTNEEISPSNDDSAEISDSEVIDAEFIEQNTNEISDVENNSTSVDEVVTEENPLPDNDAKIIEENSVPETSGEIIDVPTDEQNNSDYDFEEFDEEEEILPDDSEKQPKVEILPEDNQHSETEIDNLEENISPENNSEQIQTVEANVKPDLQTVLAEDMAVIRGNSREKNVFRNNVTAIRTLQQI